MPSIVSTASEAKEYIRRMPTQDTFAHYQEIVTPVLGRYSGISSPNVEALRLRYETELASLHVICEIATQWKRLTGHPIDLTIDGYSHLYPRFSLPPSLRQRVAEWVSSVNLPTIAAPLFEQIAEIVLTQDKKRPLGEFYTPSHIARHLADGLNPSLVDLAQGQRVMDPACGSGTLLATVAHDLVAAALAGKVEPKDTLSQFNAIFYGFDIQPFAVLLTRWQLLLTALPLLLRVPGLAAPTFPNIKLRDALLDPEPLWRESEGGNYIITNPPFAKIPLERVPLRLAYQDVLYGQPNLYQLFLWWSVQAIRPGGKIAIVVPQSFRAGLYFEKLRQQLNNNCRLISVTQFTDRVGVFADVDSPLMIITLEKIENHRTGADSPVLIRVSRNGRALDKITPTSIPRRRVMRSHLQSPVWLISNHLIDYDIVDKVYNQSVPFGKIKANFSAHNGGFVWNQHKALLKANDEPEAIPLLSTQNVGSLQFRFPTTYLVHEGRQFAAVSSKVTDRRRSRICLLVKRTTPKKRGRRVIASLVSDEFVEQYPEYFVENHVNYVYANRADGQTSALLIGLAGWFNSRLLNFMFQMMNGNSHISVHEMEMLPVPVDFLSLIAPVAAYLAHARRAAGSEERPLLSVWKYLDHKIYTYYNLTETERSRVNSLIPAPGV